MNDDMKLPKATEESIRAATIRRLERALEIARERRRLERNRRVAFLVFCIVQAILIGLAAYYILHR